MTLTSKDVQYLIQQGENNSHKLSLLKKYLAGNKSGDQSEIQTSPVSQDNLSQPDKELTRAAVLIPIFSPNKPMISQNDSQNSISECPSSPEMEKDYHLIFTLRSNTVRDHKGQISFPGGIIEKEDNSKIETALRETEEELGISEDNIMVLGKMEDLITVTGYRITPVVGEVMFPFEMTVNRAEIDQVIQVPLNHLLDKKNVGEMMIEYEGKPYNLVTFQYKKHIIWGATARMLKRFLRIWRKLPE